MSKKRSPIISFIEKLKQKNITQETAAKILNINVVRFRSILYGVKRPDNSEFKKIKSFIMNIPQSQIKIWRTN